MLSANPLRINDLARLHLIRRVIHSRKHSKQGTQARAAGTDGSVIDGSEGDRVGVTLGDPGKGGFRGTGLPPAEVEMHQPNAQMHMPLC